MNVQLSSIEKELSDASLDPVEFFGSSPDDKYRAYAVRLHPDRYDDDSSRAEAKRLFQWLGELKSQRDKPPETVTSPERTYEIRSFVARGDLCDVYYAVSGKGRYVLKRPFVALPAANNLLAKERECLEQLQEAAKGSTYWHYLPQPIESFAAGKQRINVFAWRDGLYPTISVVTKHGPLESRHIAWMFKRMLSILGFIHQQKWCHAAVLPQHCLWHVDSHGLLLCDWIHATQFGKQVSVVPASHKAFYPTIKAASPAFDIWLAGRTVTKIAGGEDELPPLIRSFLRACYLEKSMAPDDAWSMCDDFTNLLDQMYGPPVFVPLEM